MYLVLLIVVLLFSSMVVSPPSGTDFRDKQTSHSRVKEAYSEKEPIVRQLFASRGLTYPPKQIYLRAFKLEGRLEIWVKQDRANPYVLLKEYAFCTSSGGLGPKRVMGDGQIPEGFYYIDRFNPLSNFHLSLGINYPNQADRIHGTGAPLGGDIFIHGGCASIGCVPITDEGIKELYIVAIEAAASGQTKIPVHIFPSREIKDSELSANNERVRALWQSLKKGIDYFDKYRRPPQVKVDRAGQYIVLSADGR
jgi:murein L,D-transpeptidase YafK